MLWVKGSGGDLRTAKRANFASLYMDKLLACRRIYDRAETKGAKTEIEDAMVAMYRHTVYGLNPAAGSIDTPLHGFIPLPHVDHMHPISVIAIAASADQEALTAGNLWRRGRLGALAAAGFRSGPGDARPSCQENPNLQGLVMGQHGLINWADDDKACYELHTDPHRKGRALYRELR